MENYICINGKKAELTEEQMKALGIEVPKENPFERAELNKNYYFINSRGNVVKTFECGTCSSGSIDDEHYATANYCTDKAIIEQRALHETLNRLLWRYSMEHDGDKINWDNVSDKHAICYDNDTNQYKVEIWNTIRYCGIIYFHTMEIAKNAIEEIIKPFMAEHPDFKL